jgi:Heterokaryon incompatibility protein (HET)
VQVSGQEMLVTQNLKDALRNIRKPKDLVILWADAICINQQDEKEKEVQVQMMRDIYGTARLVTAFLGRGTDEGLSLIGEINRIGKMVVDAGIQTLSDAERMDLLNDRIYDSSSEVKRAVLELADQAGRTFPWKAYNDFTKYEYWKRVWVFQEFCITAECRILLGHAETAFETFAGAHVLLILMTGRTLDLLTKENVDLGLKVLGEGKAVNVNDQVSSSNNVGKGDHFPEVAAERIICRSQI